MAGLRGWHGAGTRTALRGSGTPELFHGALQESSRELWSCENVTVLAVPVKWSAWLGECPEHCSWVLDPGLCSVEQGWVAVEGHGKTWSKGSWGSWVIPVLLLTAVGTRGALWTQGLCFERGHRSAARAVLPRAARATGSGMELEEPGPLSRCVCVFAWCMCMRVCVRAHACTCT